MVDHEHVKRFTKQLRCTLTQDERLQRADELAKAHQEVEAEELRQKEIKSQLKAELEAKQATRSSVAHIVASGAEYRPVDVEQVYDYLVCRVYATRLDTGERIEDRRMTEDERQMPLPGSA